MELFVAGLFVVVSCLLVFLYKTLSVKEVRNVESIPDIKEKELHYPTVNTLTMLRSLTRFYSPENGDFFKWNTDRIRLRFLPNWFFSTESNFAARRQHYLKTGDKGLQCTKCLDVASKKWIGECPICEHGESLWREAGKISNTYQVNEKLATQAKQCKAVERYYYNAIVRGEESPPKIFSCGKVVHCHIQSLANDPDYGNIFDPIKGSDIWIRRELKSSFPFYDAAPVRNPSPIGTQTDINNCLANIWDLEKVAQSWNKTPEQLKQAMLAYGIITVPITTPKKLCFVCNKPMAHNNETVKFCSKACSNTFIANKSGCPRCATTITVPIDGLTCYLCGYQSCSGTVNRKCKSFLDCTCDADVRGCNCNCTSPLIDDCGVDADQEFINALRSL